MHEEQLKVCTHCGTAKPVTDFHRAGTTSTGEVKRRGECKDCSKELKRTNQNQNLGGSPMEEKTQNSPMQSGSPMDQAQHFLTPTSREDMFWYMQCESLKNAVERYKMENESLRKDKMRLEDSKADLERTIRNKEHEHTMALQLKQSEHEGSIKRNFSEFLTDPEKITAALGGLAGLAGTLGRPLAGPGQADGPVDKDPRVVDLYNWIKTKCNAAVAEYFLAQLQDPEIGNKIKDFQTKRPNVQTAD